MYKFTRGIDKNTQTIYASQDKQEILSFCEKLENVDTSGLDWLPYQEITEPFYCCWNNSNENEYNTCVESKYSLMQSFIHKMKRDSVADRYQYGSKRYYKAIDKLFESYKVKI